MNKLIKIKNIFVDFLNRNILDNISMSISSNKIITLIGPNGAGKSTLVRVILGLLKPRIGYIQKIPFLKIGYVPQKFYINTSLPITVYKFMQLFKGATSKKINVLLNFINAINLKNFQLNQLSAGEMQRILLVRSLLNNPELLILDEPSQGLDIIGKIELYQFIQKIKNALKCSILIVSHDLNLVMAQTDEVICLNRHICCSGAPEVISKNSEFISMFGSVELKSFAFYRHNKNHNHNHDYNF